MATWHKVANLLIWVCSKALLADVRLPDCDRCRASNSGLWQSMTSASVVPLSASQTLYVSVTDWPIAYEEGQGDRFPDECASL